MSASTAGQSVVTFAQMATRQAYVITATSDALLHHTDSIVEPTKADGPSQLAKLESEKKKAAKKTSLQAAAIQGAIDRRAARNAGAEDPRPPILGPHPRDATGRLVAERASLPIIGPPPRDAAGRFIDESASLPPSMSTNEREVLRSRAKAELQRRKSASNTPAAETATDARMKQMELQMQKMQQLVEENARLNSLIHQLIENQRQAARLYQRLYRGVLAKESKSQLLSRANASMR
jgi:hypothetical protein